MLKIESSSNPLFKQTKKLLTRAGRKKTGLFILEGQRLVCDSAGLGADIQYIFVSEDFDISAAVVPQNIKIYALPDKLFSQLKSTVNSQGILAVAGYNAGYFSDIDFSSGLYLYLDSVSDPGNMGTIIRSANAFGVDGIILSEGCVDVFNPKVLRSTMSGIFCVNIYFDDGNALDALSQNGFKIAGTFPKGEFSPRDFDYTDKCVIVMGNEANGISPEVESLCTDKITIPMTECTESLNVSIACGIMLYEAYNYRK